MTLIRLAKFNGHAQLELHSCDISSTEYVAISHVWGDDAIWRDIEGVQDRVLASERKAAFIVQELPQLLGGLYCWMDILCVDQSDPLARKEVVRSIPDIFRLAVRTIAVRDGDGLKSCCAAATDGFLDWNDDGDRKLFDHLQDHTNETVAESYLNRLWTLQEMLLSDVVHFTNCPPRPSSNHRPYDAHWFKLDFDRINDGLLTLGNLWRRYGSENESNNDEFVRAYISGGIVRRMPRSEPLDELGFPGNLFYDFFLNSCRTATVPSDYILAVFPQFRWYKLPSDYKHMSFSELFLDVYQQAQASGHGFIPRITPAMVSGWQAEDPWGASAEIPEPKSLGDFLKLMGSSMGNQSLTNAAFTGPVLLRDAMSSMDLPQALQAVRHSMEQSYATWHEAHNGELSLFGSWPDEDPFGKNLYFGIDDESGKSVTRPDFRDWYIESCLERIEPEWIQREARKILDLLYCSQSSLRTRQNGDMMHTSWKTYKKWLLENNPPFYKEEVLMNASLVNCLIPLSALSWARETFRPVIVTFPGKASVSLLGLLSKAAAQGMQPHASFSIITKELPTWPGMSTLRHFCWRPEVAYGGERLSKRKWPAGQNLVLVDIRTRTPIGLLPNFMYLLEEDDAYTGKLTQLYCMAKKVRHDQVATPFMRIESVQPGERDLFYDAACQTLSMEELQALLNPEASNPSTGV